METHLTNPEVTLLVAELQVGMFVSDVSCGWRNTPFALQGMLITSTGEILLLKRFAEHVTVDIRRCTELVAGELQQRLRHLTSDIEFSQKGSASSVPPALVSYRAEGTQAAEYDDVTHKARDKWWRELRAWLDVWKRSPAYNARRSDEKRLDFLPTNINLFAYEEPVFQPSSVPIAITACQATLTLLKDVAGSIAQNRPIHAASLEGASQMMAEHIIAHPGAVLWATKTLAAHEHLYLRSLEVGIFLALLGRQLSFPRDMLAQLSMAGFVLDLGKTKVDPLLLHKSAPLDPGETETVRAHVFHTIDMLRQIDELPESVAYAVREHHERIDGKGYPQKLQGAQISLYGKMAAIIDGYVAMTNPRPYAHTLSPHEAFRELFKGADSHWHRALVEQFVQAVGIYPSGTLVELTDDRLAIVMHDFRLHRLEPTVLVVTNDSKEPLLYPVQIDLWRHNIRHEGSKLLIRRGLPDGSHGVLLKNYYFGKP